MPFVTHHGARISWREEGQGSPLLLIMGHRWSSAMWYLALPALAAKHRVVLFDNRGVGDSDTTRGVTISQMAGDALAVLDAAGIARAHIYGVSMGGGIAQEVARLAPERVISLILGCTLYWTPDKPRLPGWLREVLYRLPAPLVQALRGRKLVAGLYGSAAPADLVAQDLARIDADKHTRAGVLEQARAMSAYSPPADAANAITMPTLVLHGDEDGVVPYAYGVELAKALPDATLVTLPGAGHNYFVAAGKTADDAVIAFLDRVDGTRA